MDSWNEDFTGAVIDYRAYTDSQRHYFTLRDATRTLSTAALGTGLEGALYAGLEALTEQLLGQEWERDNGPPLLIKRCLIDANLGHSTEVIYRLCRQCAHPTIVASCHGRFFRGSQQTV